MSAPPKKREDARAGATVDYHDMVTRDTPRAERRRLNIGDVWINAALCQGCGDYLRSKNRHDFVTCACGNLSVDGGSWYCKRLVGKDSYLDLSEQFTDARADEGGASE